VIDYEYLRPFAAAHQIPHLDAYRNTGGFRAAARQLGLNEETVRSSIKRLARTIAVRGLSPDHLMTQMVPEPFVVRGVSTMHKTAEGLPQWVKSRLDDAAYQVMLKEAIAEFIAPIAPIQALVPTGEFDTDIIPWIQIGDAHLGMLAHEAETGEHFNLDIAERELCAAFSMLIDEMPATERVVINDLGDFTHYENSTATTEASGHALDHDRGFRLMIKAYSRIMRFVVERALAKFRFVDVIVNQGNHSRTNDLWMAELLEVTYGHTGRVNVLNNGSVFIAYRMGNTLVMTHHSDKCRPADLVGVMITDYRRDFGETEYHYIDIGHIHHKMVAKEHPAVTLESWNQLAAGDQYAHDKGYRSRQSMAVVYRSRSYGEVGRRILPIQQVRDAILAGHRAQKGRKGQLYVPSHKLAFVA
jgi:hypothetical protein